MFPLAHRGAWKELHMIHRDISGGNILIYPRIVNDGRKRLLVWQGILGDWELAKDVRVLRQTQPERTVSGGCTPGQVPG